MRMDMEWACMGSPPQLPPVLTAQIPAASVDEGISKYKALLKNVPYLAIPFYFGFNRCVRNLTDEDADYWGRVSYENDGTSFSTIEEVHKYLIEKKIPLPISCFTFEVRVDPSYKHSKGYWKDMTLKMDLSEGQEVVPIPVICNKTPCNLVTYIKKSRPTDQRTMVQEDEGFLICCDCPNDCKDKMKCPCFLTTLENCSIATRNAVGDENVGYKYQRLQRQFMSGIYECNKTCKCQKETCHNRVVQNGLVWNLQLYMTERKGWGVRTLNDIPTGAFICSYAGEIVTGEYANEVSENWDEGKWKYLSDLKLGETEKEGYEAEVIEPVEKEKEKIDGQVEEMNLEGSDESSEEDLAVGAGEDPSKTLSNNEWNNFLTDENASNLGEEEVPVYPRALSPATSCFSSVTVLLQGNDGEIENNSQEDEVVPCSVAIPKRRRSSPISPQPAVSSPSVGDQNDDEDTTHKSRPCPSNPLVKRKRVQSPSPASRVLRSFENVPESPQNYELLPTGRAGFLQVSFENTKLLSRLNAQSEKLSQVCLAPSKRPPNRRRVTTHMFLNDYNMMMRGENERYEDLEKQRKEKEKNKGKRLEQLKQSTLLSSKFIIENVLNSVANHKKMDENSANPQQQEEKIPWPQIRQEILERSKRKISYKAKLRQSLSKLCPPNQSALRKPTKKRRRRRKRLIFSFKRKSVAPSTSKPRDHPLLKFNFSIDGYKFGNIGRYMNHSCDGNVFPQYVFIDTHDLRFPEVGFFALRNIHAGEELTWDYHYNEEDEDKEDIGGAESNSRKKRMTGKSFGKQVKKKESSHHSSAVRMPCFCGEDNCTGKIC